MDEDLLARTEHGLACAAGGFHVDPWEPVPLAVVTHARADRVRPGCGRYVTAAPGAALLRRLVGEAPIDAIPYGEPRAFGDVMVSLHPSGHMLGGAQVRIAGERVWVVAGDWTRTPDPTCAAFEVVRADVLLTEAVFALPIYRWPAPGSVIDELLAWCEANRSGGRASVLFASSPGGVERVLGRLGDREVLVHPALEPTIDAYRGAGVALAPARVLAEGKRAKVADLVLAPFEARGTAWAKRLRGETAFAAGSARVRGVRRRRGFDRGFVLSGHADWPALLETVAATGARRVIATHGRSHVLARALAERGLEASVLETPWRAEDDA